jgi:hypothetical protein
LRTSKKNSKTKVTHRSNPSTRWAKAILDAETMLQEAKQRVANLERTVKAFRELQASGAPFPGESPLRDAQWENQRATADEPLENFSALISPNG